MKHLILIRHAKSSWDFSVIDKDRPLTDRGIRDAHLVASHIASGLPKNFIIWSSTAKRASETAVIFAQNIYHPLGSIIFKDELYTFDIRQLEKIVKSCMDECNCMILFGHNEGITEFVNKFGDVNIDNVPTSGFVSILFNTDSWKNIGKGSIQKIVFPNDLK